MQARFEEITQLTDAFCQHSLTEEYARLCRELTATLCRKRLSPVARGKAPTWACGIIHALGMVNFLFDSSQTPPHRSQPDLGVFRSQFEYDASQIKADPGPARDLTHGPGVVHRCDAGPEPADLDA